MTGEERGPTRRAVLAAGLGVAPVEAADPAPDAIWSGEYWAKKGEVSLSL